MPFLSRALAENPGGVALRDDESSLTYEELAGRVQAVAGSLRKAGLRTGDTVAVEGSLNAGLLVSLHGAWMAGAAVAPLNPGWTPQEVARAVDLLAPSLMVGPGGIRQGPEPAPASEALAARILTSGTSGSPRVVGLTADNLLASAEGSRIRLGLGSDDRWLASLSPSHVGGLAMVTRAAVVGGTLHLSRGLEGFDPNVFLALAEAGTVTHASLVPTMLHRILLALGPRRAPRGLRCLLIGGAPARRELVQRGLAAGLPLALTYGLTEAASQVATAPPALVRKKPGSVGAPLPGVEVRITDEDEIQVRGGTLAPGVAGEDGWLGTGDLGRFDQDGHLWVTGRLSDRIISGGVNVDPEEVAAVFKSHPGVEEAVALGLPDPEWGERVAVVVVGRPGSAPAEGELDHLARESLSSPKRPRALRFIEALPLNPNGKVDREKLRELFR